MKLDSAGLKLGILVVGLLLPTAVLAGGPGPKVEDKERFVDAAFVGLLNKAFPGDSLDLGRFHEPCGRSSCMGYSLSLVERGKLVKILPQLAGGFGYGADVRRLTLTGRTTVLTAADLEVVVSPASRIKPELLAQRAAGLLALFRHVGALSEKQEGQFSPRQTSADARVYYLLSLTCLFDQQECAAAVLAPPKAPVPTAAEPEDTCVEARVEGGGKPYSTGLFAGWQRFKVTWKHVCKVPSKPIQ